MSTLHKAGLGLALAGLSLALSASSVHAQTTVFTNFGPGSTFVTDSGSLVNGPTSFLASLYGYRSVGEGFMPTLSGSLSTINVAISNEFGTNDAHLFLAADAGGVPGTVLESFTLTNLPNLGTAYTPDLLTSVSHPLLTAGATYFLYESEMGSEDNIWNDNSIGETGLVTTSYGGSPYFTGVATQGAFSVQVNAPTTVPEPSTAAAFACGALGLAGLMVSARRRARA